MREKNAYKGKRVDEIPRCTLRQSKLQAVQNENINRVDKNFTMEIRAVMRTEYPEI